MAVEDSTLSEKCVSRFASKYDIQENGCWIWTGGLLRGGYGSFEIKCRPNRECGQAHRVSWRIHCGTIPAGMMVLHRCDVPRCVNPDHLFLGTQKDNMQDMSRKGRASTERHNTKLTETDVAEIRATHKPKYGALSQMARKYGVHAITIRRILNGKSWV